MKILNLAQIRAAIPSVDLMAEIEYGFVTYSEGKAVVPPVGELILQDPPGDVHIKYGYIKGDDFYVIKIASGFYENRKFGLPSNNGMMLIFSQQTGEPVAALLDEGWLTAMRTAIAGAIAAKYLAPANIDCIGIVGTGMQARLQLEYLAPVTECREVLLWGRDESKFEACTNDMKSSGFNISTTTDVVHLMQRCKLIVTTTPAEDPILNGFEHLQPGTHITAMGSDTHTKQEVEADILRRADLVVADSIPQCLERGEIYQALKQGAIDEAGIVELGSIISGVTQGRTADDQVTIADLTGVAVQDIQITKAVFEAVANC
jgi:ornithine cyclodeaminase/alanine dehydrogenase-like protein (mu-crystallin family)